METCEHAHRRRFTGSVRAEEANNLPLGHLKRDLVHGRGARVPLRKLLNFDHTSAVCNTGIHLPCGAAPERCGTRNILERVRPECQSVAIDGIEGGAFVHASIMVAQVL
jgi:hypothetical protein